MDLRYPINLMENGDVITSEGEYLGTWDTDEADLFHRFTPSGGSEPTIINMHLGPFCAAIRAWHEVNG